MKCTEALKDVSKVLPALYKLKNENGVGKVIHDIRNHTALNATLSTYFKANPKATTKLVETQIQDTIALTLKNVIENYVTKEGVVQADTYDNFLIDPMYTGNNNITEGWQSIIGLLYKAHKNEYGKITHYTLNDEVAKAVSIATTDWLVNDAESDLAEHRHPDTVRAILGIDKKDTITTEMYEKLNGFDTLYNRSINTIGSKAYKLLGIKADSDTNLINNHVLEAKLKAELGMLSLAGLENVGMLTVKKTDIDDTRKGIKVVSFNNKRKVGRNGDMSLYVIAGGVEVLVSSKTVKDSAGKLYDSVVGEPTKYGVFTTKSDAVPKRSEIVNEGPSGELGDVVSSAHKDAVIKQSSTPYRMKNGFNKLVQKLHKDGVLLELLGYKNEEDVLDVKLEAVRGKNNMLADSINYLQEAYDEFGLDKDMYARWKVITNNRFMIDSNKLNWQDKKLHRYAVYNRKVEVTKSNENGFKLMLGQSFGVSVDKQTAEKLLVANNNEIDIIIDKLSSSYDIDEATQYATLEEYQNSETYAEHAKILLEVAKEGKYNLGEPEHLLSGISELLNWNYTGRGTAESYYTESSIETDAITSGYAIKNMQIPILFGSNIDAQIKELEKMGVFTEASKSYGARNDDTDALDSYEDPAKELTKELRKNSYDVPLEVLKLIDPKYDEDRGFSRNFMKNPFMVLNYGSAINSIIQSTANLTVDNLYNMINTYYIKAKNYYSSPDYNPKDPDYEIERELGDEYNRINKILHVLQSDKKRDLPKNLEALRKFQLSPDERTTLIGYVYAADEELEGQPTFGNALKVVLTKKYKPFIELTRTTNELFTVQFRIARKLLDRRIKELHKTKVLKLVDDAVKEDSPEYKRASRLVPPINKKEMQALVQEMSYVLPVLNSVLKTDDGITSKLLIAKRQRVSTKEGDVELLGNIASPGLRTKSSGNRLTHGAIELYKLVEAYSSGAVVPIHFFDGSVQAEVLKSRVALGVHDANYFSIDEFIEGTKDYNKHWINLNKDYHLVHEIMQSVVKTFTNSRLEDGVLEDILKELNEEYSKPGSKLKYADQIKKYITDLSRIEKLSETNREKLFSKTLYVEHAYAETLDKNGNKVSAKYEYEPTKYETKTTSENVIQSITRKLDNTKLKITQNLKAADDYLPEVLISNEEAKQIDKLNDQYIQKYGIKIKFGEEFMYDPENNSITIVAEANPKDRAVYVAHEIKHAITYKWLQDGKHRKQYKYLAKSLESLKDFDPGHDIEGNILRQRLDYVLSRKDEFTQVAELVAVLSSEPSVRRAFIKQFPQNESISVNNVLNTIKKVLGKLWSVDTRYVVKAVDSIVEDALETQIKERELVVDPNNKNRNVKRVELYKNDKVVAYASLGKAKINGMLNWNDYLGDDVDKTKVYRTLNMIHSNERGLGYADAVMGRVINEYGNEDILLEVLPMDDTTNEEKLISWYSKYGFEVISNTGDQIIMIRRVENSSSNSDDSMLETGIIATKTVIDNSNTKCKG